jgi:hypothetical protein
MTGSKRVDLWTSGTVCECSEIAGSPQDSKLLSFSKLSFRLKTGESITNTNNSANIQKIRNNFYCRPAYLDQKKLFGEKNRDENARDSVPISSVSDKFVI